MRIENGVLYDVCEGDIKNGTFEIPPSVTSIGDGAFWNCSNLETIEIPSCVTSIRDRAFWNCTNLKTIKILSSITSIGIGAFCYCHNLKTIKIPSSVTSIGNVAFNGCASLKSIVISSNVTSIGDSAFCGCSKLKKLGKFKATDGDMTCLGFQYELGKWYEEPEAALCEKGFHYCENAFDLFKYYFGEIGKDVRFFEVETEDDSDECSIDSKRVCKRIKLVREIKSYEELLN